jgi:cell fate (sporulation/competence/biofilm development) regulator YlbF (YheA/YmcA/DUF963 family)
MSFQEKYYRKFIKKIEKKKPPEKVIKAYVKYQKHIENCQEKCFPYDHELHQKARETYQEYKQKSLERNFKNN